jgi:hypothetical protein
LWVGGGGVFLNSNLYTDSSGNLGIIILLFERN